MYLFEPYNAYQKPAKKKHWTQIAEEEALFIKTQMEESIRRQSIEKTLHQQAIEEHLALREAAAKQAQLSTNNQNVALPQYAPQPAQQQVQNGQFAAPAGGGGWVSKLSEEENEVASFDASPRLGIGPLIVSFVNNSPFPADNTFLWQFGSASLTSTSANPSPVTYTQTGSYIVTLQETSSTGYTSTATRTIVVSDPTLVVSFTVTENTGSAPSTASFTNTTTYNGSGTLTYLWQFGTGSLTSTSANPAPLIYTRSGSYTASLQVTESSYRHTGFYTSSFALS